MKIKELFAKKTLRLSKKAKLNILGSAVLVLLIIVVFVVNIVYNITRYTPEFYKISSNKISDKMRIVFITDLHLREYGDENSGLLQDIKNLSPDLILIGGDLVIDREKEYSNMLSFCEALTEISPTYGVWGNHEDIKFHIFGDKELKSKLDATGVRFLINETESVKIKNNEITICGVDGYVTNFEKYGAKEVMESFNKMQGFKICLAHVPTYFTEKLDEYEFDLGLAGHTHGGVINVPGLGPLYSREEGFLPDYTEGCHTLKNNGKLIISRGMGHSSYVPRINNVPELSVIDVD